MGWFGNDEHRLAGTHGTGNTLTQQADRTEHYAFLVDTSGSMRDGGVAKHFSEIHGEFLDALAERHPNAVVSLITFNETPHIQYVAKPISTAPSLDMNAKFGTDLPVAICDGLVPVIGRVGSTVNRTTAIIVTDGDFAARTARGHEVDPHRVISDLRRRGVRFLLLVADSCELDTYARATNIYEVSQLTGRSHEEMILSLATTKAEDIGIHKDEIMLWGHSAKALSKTFAKVGDMLTLGSAPSSASSPVVALPPHRH